MVDPLRFVDIHLKTAMSEAGFYVTLPCNASLYVYPDNTISSYRTMLSRTLNLKGEWEVGLIEFVYPISWYTFPEEDAAYIVTDGRNRLEDFEEQGHGHHAVGEGIKISIDNDGQSISKLCNRLKTGYYEDIVFLIREINTTLPPGTTLGYDHVKNKVFLKAPPKISLTFFGRLAIILGLKPGAAIESAKKHDENYIGGVTPVTYAPHQADINGGFYTLYIYTDIIEYQSVGDSYVPLLRCVHIDGENNKIVSVRYDKPHYVPVNKASITEIAIEVKDDQDQNVRFTYGKVSAKLHFRPVKQVVF